MSIEVLPLGAGQDVGRSCCIVRMAGRTVMFDCGAHFGFRDARRFPEFGLLSRAGRFTEIIDAVVITHFHTDHLGALPYFTEICGYRGPILMTYPTFAIAPIMLADYVKVNADRPGERLPYNEQHVRDCLRRVTAVDLHQVVVVAPGLSFTFHYAGHVLGAAMVHMTAGHLTALYTGDFNSSPDRHLGPAEAPLALLQGGPSGASVRHPDVLISEATYAATLRDSKRARERDLLGAVVETVAAGGKVLIPTFAMGRAQELLMLITDCWERNGLQVPIYFSSAMAARALVYYQLLLNWTNANVRRTIFGAAASSTGPALAADAGAAAARHRSQYYRPYNAPDEPGGGGSGGCRRGDDNPLAVDYGRAVDDSADEQFDEGNEYSSDDQLYDREYGDGGDGEDDGARGGDGRPGSGEWASGSGGGSGGSGSSSRRRWRRRRQPILPLDISQEGGGDMRRTTAAPAAHAAAATADEDHTTARGGGNGGGGARGGSGRGVFSEADVYGMFRTRPWDRSLLNAPGPALLFASPGNIASGVALEAFRSWAGSSKNLLVLAGYQVRGTLGARLEAIQNTPAGQRQQQQQQQQHQQRTGAGGGGGDSAPTASSTATVEVPNLPAPGGATAGGGGGGGSSRVEVRCRIKMLAFSAHADLRGLLGLVRRCKPRAVVLVHGQREPMEFLRGRIETHVGIECHAPATGTTVTIAPRRAVPLGVRPQLVSTSNCAAGALAAQSAAVAAGLARKAQLLCRLKPQPLTALPLSGIVVARVTPAAAHQLQPGPVQQQQQQHPALPADGGGGGGVSATQLTLTDSGTAAKVLLQAYQESKQQSEQQAATAVMPYAISYGCTLDVRLPRAAETDTAVAAALALAHTALCTAVGGYSASRRLQVDTDAMALSFGTFRAQLSVAASNAGSKDNFKYDDVLSRAGGQDANVIGAAAVVGESPVISHDGDGDGSADCGGIEGSRGAVSMSPQPPPPLLQMRMACQWSASEVAAACRCLEALRRAFGITDNPAA